MVKRVYDPIHDVFQEAVKHPRKVMSVGEMSNGEKEKRSIDISSIITTESPEKDGSNDTNKRTTQIEDVKIIHDDEETDSDLGEEDQNHEADAFDAEGDAEGDADADQEEYDQKKDKSERSSSNKYTRHLKKPDGELFTRKDVQYEFLRRLLVDDRLLFDNHLKSTFQTSLAPLSLADNRVPLVTEAEYDARTFVFNDKLSFAQLYALTMASSSKCSKILRDKLLLDSQVAFSTCILAFLVNIGRLNTTINFYLEMTSQLRTYHSVPCLQLHSSESKSLQDTPRIKSILRNLPQGNDTVNLSLIYKMLGVIDWETFNAIGEVTPQKYSKDNKIEEDGKNFDLVGKFNIINMIFALCDSATIVRLNFLMKYVKILGTPSEEENVDDEKELTLFNILDNSKYEVEDRVNVILWLFYVHLQTNLKPEELVDSMKLFRASDISELEDDKLPLRYAKEEYDVDTPEEIAYGDAQKLKRKDFLLKMGKADSTNGNEDGKKHSDKESNTSPRKRRRRTTEKDKGTTSSKKIKKEDIDEQDDLTKKNPALNKKLHKDHDPTVSEKNDNEETSPKKSKLSVHEERAKKLVDYDHNKEIGLIESSRETKTQQQLLNDLNKAHEYCRLKRKDLGMLRIFNRYDDIPMGSVIGVRGKKRRKYRDEVLGYETDYLRTLGLAKQKFLKKLQENAEVEKQDLFQL
ncbi:Ies1p [Nakaseomyces bracarensis]|uniref:Ies1p n=1 Tax=Nakaseomyces bracarensis TaxID=273131 RepID=UPI0038729E42